MFRLWLLLVWGRVNFGVRGIYSTITIVMFAITAITVITMTFLNG